jgi:hypothetical protein
MNGDEAVGLFAGGSLAFGLVIALCTIVPTLAIFGGIGWLIYRSYHKAQAQRLAAQQWPSTMATVVRSWVDVSQHSSLDANGFSTTSTAYTPKVVYNYMVNGRAYSNDRVTVGAWAVSRSQDTAEATVHRFPPGATVPVFYNPTNPADSALER